MSDSAKESVRQIISAMQAGILSKKIYSKAELDTMNGMLEKAKRAGNDDAAHFLTLLYWQPQQQMN